MPSNNIDIADCANCANNCADIAGCADISNCANCAGIDSHAGIADSHAGRANCDVPNCDVQYDTPIHPRAVAPASTANPEPPSPTQNPLLHIVSHIINDTTSANANERLLSDFLSPPTTQHYLVKRQDTSTTTQTHTLSEVTTSSSTSTVSTVPSTTSTSTSILTTTVSTSTSLETVTATGSPTATATVTTVTGAAGRAGADASVFAGMASWVTLFYLLVMMWRMR
ncbi:hypothetical protein TWF696_002417 [Orbilia brochopaga]|uniref:Uncharacterized protein n=1 Tax=Orbilia brochopaga TaxID=3140254 RepID=A0AAV9U8J3_9PEZI